MVFSWIAGLVGKGTSQGTSQGTGEATTTAHPLDTVDVTRVNALGPPVNSMMRAKVIDVYDGDTVTILFQLGDMIFKEKLRLSGIDAPEMRTRSDAEKAAAIRSRDWLREQILDTHVLVFFRNQVKEKYGRLIGEVYSLADNVDTNDPPSTLSYNSKLVQLGLAVAYDGGSKKPFVPDESA